MIKRVNWLEIKVTDIKNAISFYRDVLGLKIKNEWSNYVVFDLAGTLTLAIMLGGKMGRKEEHQTSIWLWKTLMRNTKN